MLITAMICDDLPEERISLARMLRHYENSHDLTLKLESAQDGVELLARWRPERWDIIFLDIYMPGMNGIDAARQLRQVDRDCALVLFTTSMDHGVAGFELQAMDYLTKPVRQEDVDRVMDWFLRTQSDKLRELTVRVQWGEQTIRVQDIRYIESRGHACVIHAEGQDVSTRGSIGELMEELEPAGSFFRCHQSFVLNFDYVRSIENRAFVLDGGERVPISAPNLSRSKSALLEWIAERDWKA